MLNRPSRHKNTHARQPFDPPWPVHAAPVHIHREPSDFLVCPEAPVPPRSETGAKRPSGEPGGHGSGDHTSVGCRGAQGQPSVHLHGERTRKSRCRCGAGSGNRRCRMDSPLPPLTPVAVPGSHPGKTTAPGVRCKTPVHPVRPVKTPDLRGDALRAFAGFRPFAVPFEVVSGSRRAGHRREEWRMEG